jgi:hypothetical protein
MGERRRRRLLARVAGMARVLAADDARRARRARRAAKGGAERKEEEGDLGSFYNAAAAVPAGVIYPEGQSGGCVYILCDSSNG